MRQTPRVPRCPHSHVDLCRNLCLNRRRAKRASQHPRRRQPRSRSCAAARRQLASHAPRHFNRALTLTAFQNIQAALARARFSAPLSPGDSACASCSMSSFSSSASTPAHRARGRGQHGSPVIAESPYQAPLLSSAATTRPRSPPQSGSAALHNMVPVTAPRALDDDFSGIRHDSESVFMRMARAAASRMFEQRRGRKDSTAASARGSASALASSAARRSAAQQRWMTDESSARSPTECSGDSSRVTGDTSFEWAGECSRGHQISPQRVEQRGMGVKQGILPKTTASVGAWSTAPACRRISDPGSRGDHPVRSAIRAAPGTAMLAIRDQWHRQEARASLDPLEPLEMMSMRDLGAVTPRSLGARAQRASASDAARLPRGGPSSVASRGSERAVPTPRRGGGGLVTPRGAPVTPRGERLPLANAEIARMQGSALEAAAWAFVKARAHDCQVGSERERRYDADARLVAARAAVSLASAREALRQTRGDAVEAIMLLRDAMM